MLEGNFITKHDFTIASLIADVMTGGDLEARHAGGRTMAAGSGRKALRAC